MPFLALALLVLCAGCFDVSFPGSKAISLETVPPEAEIRVDGRFVGLTPKEIVAGPNATVTVSLKNYKVEAIYASKIKGDKAFLHFELKELFEVYLAYQPEGSEVYEEGVLLGKTPLKVLRPKCPMLLLVRHDYFYDYMDDFYVSGPILRAENLKASVRYFPETVCIFTSSPGGAKVSEVSLLNHKIATEKSFLGTTPFETQNSELSKQGPHHLFIFEKDGYYPQAVEATGSFSAHIELVKSKGEMVPALPQVKMSQSNFTTSRVSNGDAILFPRADGMTFKVYTVQGGYEVSIADMETPATPQSGAAFFMRRFLAVRYSDPMGGAKYVAFDGTNKRKVRFENCGFFHEANVKGDIPYKQRVPILPSVIEEFKDVAFSPQKDFLLFYVRLHEGLPFYLVIKCDLSLSNPMIISTLGPLK